MVETEYQIKPEKKTPAIDTSTWPLLLKVSKTKLLWQEKASPLRLGRHFYGKRVSIDA